MSVFFPKTGNKERMTAHTPLIEYSVEKSNWSSQGKEVKGTYIRREEI